MKDYLYIRLVYISEKDHLLEIENAQQFIVYLEITYLYIYDKN